MLPTHIGVIMDGNRRFAKQIMKKPWMGHKWGAQKAMELLEELSMQKLIKTNM